LNAVAFLQLRDSAGLGPASPIALLASELRGTAAEVVFDCELDYTMWCSNRQTWDGSEPILAKAALQVSGETNR